MEIKRLTIHCSASENGKPVSVEKIREWHKARGFFDIGYHIVIDVDGSVNPGRSIYVPGAHVIGANQNNLGVCLVGNDRFSIKQFNSLRYVIDKYSVPFFCHYQFGSAKKQGKSCPNFTIEAFTNWYLNFSPTDLKENILEVKK